jgi:hypothetical protein
MAEAGGLELHQRYYEYLLDRVREDRYPSNAMLDLLEANVANENERAELVDVLMEKLQANRYPSLPMLRRIVRLAG